MDPQQSPDTRLANSQKRKVRRHLQTAVIAVVGIVAVSLVLLYGRVSVSPDVYDPSASERADLRDDAAGSPDSAVARRQFREKMNFYESEIKPRLAILNLSAWAPQEQTAMAARERDALEAFAAGNFARATTELEQLIARADELEKTHGEHFDAAFKRAHAAFDAGHAARARTALERALLYKPDNAALATLKSRVDVMAEVAQLVTAADVARAERRPDEELAALTRALALDPAHSALADRHRALVAQKRTHDFDTLLRQAETALEARNIKQARAALEQAARLSPDRKELPALTGKIEQAEVELSHRDLIRKAEAAVAGDDWAGAETHYTAAANVFPHTAEIESRIELARAINRRTQSIEQTLARPARLSDEKIAAAAQSLVEESAELAAHSPQLERLSARLSDAILEALLPVPVVVHSDSRTHISVLGTGVIGKVKKYHLKQGLKPGRYTFKGERKGFKDKLVKVEVRRGETVSVTVICDEPV